MTRYTVVWEPDVESHFISMWIACDSRSRALLTEIANWIDDTLAEDPDQKGREVDDLEARILAVPVDRPTLRVAVTYQVLPEDRLVRVVRLTIRGM